ncbi:unnamed protein product, partial [Mesorhabditis belari]|uniref:Uncharacterized protein n=1 Tax=Mesorhabditis belari TaxID=2138241 RepID=A0AAF3F233_9BILA
MKGVRRGWSECIERTAQSIMITSIDRSFDHHSDGEHQAIPICRKRARTLTGDSGKRFCQVSQDESFLSTEWIDEEKRGLEKAASAEILENFGDEKIPSTSRAQNPALNDETLAVKRKNFSESRRKKVLQRIQRPNSALSMTPIRCKTPNSIKEIENVMIESSAKENIHLMRNLQEILTKTNPQPQNRTLDLPPSISQRFSRSNLKKRSDSMGNEEQDEGIKVKQCRRERRNSSAPAVQNRLMRRRNAMYLLVKKIETPPTSSDEFIEELFCDPTSDDEQIIKNHCSFDEYRHPSMKFEWGIDGDEEKDEEEREVDEEVMEVACGDGKEVRFL